MNERLGNHCAGHKRDLGLAVLGIVLGLFLIVGTLGVLIYREYWYRKGFAQGRFSASAIEHTRQTILQIPPSAEGIQKIADFAFRRMSADAQALNVSWSSTSDGLTTNFATGVIIIVLSVKLKRTVKRLANHEKQEAVEVSSG
jgi:hypothetical protein